MPRLNLFLDAPVELDHEAISFNDSLLAPVPKLGTKKQRQALHCILSNVGRYGRQPLFFHMRNQANPPPQYNPHGYGHKPLVAVIEQLRDNGLLQLQRGTAWGPDDDDGKLSSFMPDLKLVQLCDQLGYSKQSLAQQDHFIELRTKEKDGKGKLLSFETSAYSEHINQLMAEYCGFLNQQRLECDGESLGHIHLIRTYKDWDKSGRLIHGGRAWLPFMSFKPAKRERIKINGEAVASVDYPASVPNVIYLHLTGKRLYPEDPYEVEGLGRRSVKAVMNMMLNNDSQYHAVGAMEKYRKKEMTKPENEQLDKEIKAFGSLEQIMDAVAERNAPISESFYQGKAKGQYYAWIESNLVFEVARFLATVDVPALTVHDEFIVPQSMEEAVREYRYTVALDEQIYGQAY